MVTSDRDDAIDAIDAIHMAETRPGFRDVIRDRICAHSTSPIFRSVVRGQRQRYVTICYVTFTEL